VDQDRKREIKNMKTKISKGRNKRRANRRRWFENKEEEMVIKP
jgi:hypothetical protein